MKVTVFITAILMFAAGVFLSYEDKTGGATATYGAAVLCLIFVFLGDFKKFKGFGIEAELLEDKIKEADEVLNQLRGLVKPISELLFTMVARGGRWDSAIPRKDSYRLMEQLENELKEIGLSHDEIAKAKYEWHQFNLIDLFRPILTGISELLHEKEKAQQEVIRGFKNPIASEFQLAYKEACEEKNRISSESAKINEIYKVDDRHNCLAEIVKFMDSSYLISEEEKKEILNRFSEEIKDVEHYINTHEFRRLDVWLSEEE
ncbi:hypothetical protein ACOI2Q_07040 [Shewanella algae]|uniref:hypothetical protein n=1 Tax=Shewanella algae TaxID=38313 RepID=UPI003004C284